MFIETRGNDGNKPSKVEFSHAILNPSASFGGLFVPENLPPFSEEFLKEAPSLSYKELTLKILEMFNIDIEKEVLEEAVSLYDAFDDGANPVPLTKADENLYVNELYHGPTRAFKDMALQPFGHILSHLAQERKEDYLILAATSGDTGPATLDTFKNKSNIRVACLYPSGGTSDVQRLQMVANDGKNLKVIGIKGNFDDAQSALKSLLASQSFKDDLAKYDIKLSAANSVNFGRIIFQIIYHVHAYMALVRQGEAKMGEKVYFTVPSGNFGNALGAYYAKKMGLPIEKILIASNINNILTDLITKGEYDIRERKLLLTTSPAMDILISSNVERMIYDKLGSKRCKELMEDLKEKKVYTLSKDELALIQEDFAAIYSDDSFSKDTIKKYADKGYVMDPHTATCLKAKELEEKPLQNIICSTAEWTKFAPTMWSALQNDDKKYADKEALEGFSKSLNVEIPESINALFDAPVIHDQVVEKENIEATVHNFIAK